MRILFEIEDYAGKKIRLTTEGWTHITLFHPEISEITKLKDTIAHPTVVKPSVNNPEKVKCYYRYNKSKKRYLLVAVKYLNGEGFVITAHYKKSTK